jgi:hypothetical protein
MSDARIKEYFCRELMVATLVEFGYVPGFDNRLQT